MKESLLPYLVCPDCRGSLELEDVRRNGQEIERGQLNCERCSVAYPVRRGVPRFVATDAYTRTFSYQWNAHRTTQVDSLAGHTESSKAFRQKTGFAPDELRGKLVLDAGCGTGRYMEIAAQMGAEVIGVDLSYAVDAAYANMGSRKGIHIVQVDLRKMPFRPASFDAIYSLGVLHHTPDTREAFLSLPPMLKPGGTLAIWVYVSAGDYSRNLDRVRSVTVHLPSLFLYGLCWIAVPVLHSMARLPVLRRVSAKVPTSDQRRGLTWDVLDTFDLWSPRYQWKHTEPEVRGWFETAKLRDVSVLDFPVSMRGRRSGAEAACSLVHPEVVGVAYPGDEPVGQIPK